MADNFHNEQRKGDQQPTAHSSILGGKWGMSFCGIFRLCGPFSTAKLRYRFASLYEMIQLGYRLMHALLDEMRVNREYDMSAD